MKPNITVYTVATKWSAIQCPTHVRETAVNLIINKIL